MIIYENIKRDVETTFLKMLSFLDFSIFYDANKIEEVKDSIESQYTKETRFK